MNPAEQRHDRGGPEHRAQHVRPGGVCHCGANQAEREQEDEQRHRMVVQHGQRCDVVRGRRAPENRARGFRQLARRSARRAKDVEKHRAEDGEEDLGLEILGRRVELPRPRGERENHRHVAQEVEEGPVQAPGQIHRAGHDDGVVSEQRRLRIRRGRQEKRRREAAAHRHERQALRALAIRECGAEERDAAHQPERHRLGDQLVVVERSVGGHVEHCDAAARDHLAVQRVAGAHEPRADVSEGDARNPADHDAHRGRDPLVVEGELDEVARADDDGDDADVQEPARSDPGLEGLGNVRWDRCVRCDGCDRCDGCARCDRCDMPVHRLVRRSSARSGGGSARGREGGDVRGGTRGLRRRPRAAAELELGDALVQAVHQRRHTAEAEPHDDDEAA